MIDEIQQKIAQLFVKNKCPVLTNQMKFQDLEKFSLANYHRLNLDNDVFFSLLNNVYFSIASLQIELGQMMIAIEEAEYPTGNSFTQSDFEAYSKKDMNLANLYFWHHYSLEKECIYRVWERLTRLLYYSCYPDSFDGIKYKNKASKRYFDQLLKKIQEDKNYKILYDASRLEKVRTNWNKIANKRNYESHEESNMIGNVSIDTEELHSYRVRLPNLKQELKETIDSYLRCADAIKAASEFIDNLLRQ